MAARHIAMVTKMSDFKRGRGELFDEWPDKYDQWFKTPIGRLVKRYEARLLLDFLEPRKGELILDAGCGSGVFTKDVLLSGSGVIGMDISKPMLDWALDTLADDGFRGVLGDMRQLPFADNTFDKVVSVTAIEFLADAKTAVKELFRVTKSGGLIVITTLNSLSPWAERRKQAADNGHSLFQNVRFRSPEDMQLLVGKKCEVKTAIHFKKDDEHEVAVRIEEEGWERNLMNGAFLAVRWVKD